ncbi:MAG TPA: tetratricopeptide repeat protein [Terriglobales bacterium]|jgi:tetratricopeptide (TPR) repeat protein|nr:tetratricopeptide repeat protein [Terriglobales bacterium]
MIFTNSARFITGLFLVITLGVVLGRAESCTPPASIESALRGHPDTNSYSQLGNWYASHRHYACAAEAYRSALELKPNSSTLAYLFGLNLYSAGNSAAALNPLATSIRLSPSFLKAHIALAEALESLGRGREARAEWETALKINPHSADALNGMSKSLLAGGKYREVIDLLEANKLNSELSANLAEAYLGMKSREKAEEILANALKTDPASLRLAMLLTSVSIQQFHYQDAARLAEETVRRHPESEPAERLYLQSLVLAGNTAVARPLAQKLLAKSPNDFDYLYLLGVMEHDAGEFEAARGHLAKAVEINPASAPARFNFGLALSQLNDPAGAKIQLQKALDLGASEPEVHLQLGKVLNSLGEKENAKAQLKLYQAGLEDQHNRALAASKTGQGDKEMAGGGDPRRAVEFYREALAATPDDPQLQFKLAVALSKTGDTAGERAALEKAVAIDPNLAVAQNQLGLLSSQAGDATAAEQHFRQALRAMPDFTEAWVNLAAILGLQSRFKEADEAVSTALRLEPQNAGALLLRDTLAKAQAQR